MKPIESKPRWWPLYLAFPILIALFMVDARLKLSTRGHEAVQIGIVVLIYALIHLWLQRNEKALSEMDRERSQGTVRVIFIPSLATDTDHEKRSAFKRTLEVKGVLEDTFEMDYIDAESFSVEDVSQPAHKE